MLECFYILEQLIRVLIEGVKLLGVLLLVVGVDEDSSQVPLQAELLPQLLVELCSPPRLRDHWDRLVPPLSIVVAMGPKCCLEYCFINCLAWEIGEYTMLPQGLHCPRIHLRTSSQREISWSGGRRSSECLFV